MSEPPIAVLIRRWVDLYTRGLSTEARAARRDEIADDLWCHHEEALAIGRSMRSLDGELLARLVFGIPADVAWRIAPRRREQHKESEHDHYEPPKLRQRIHIEVGDCSRTQPVVADPDECGKPDKEQHLT